MQNSEQTCISTLLYKGSLISIYKGKTTEKKKIAKDKGMHVMFENTSMPYLWNSLNLVNRKVFKAEK